MRESEGFLEVCVVLDGRIDRNVIVTVITADGSATGSSCKRYGVINFVFMT